MLSESQNGSGPQRREWRRQLARGWPEQHIHLSPSPPPAVLENEESRNEGGE